MRLATVFIAAWLVLPVVNASESLGRVEVVPSPAASVAVGEAFTQQVRIHAGSGVRLEAAYLPHAGDAREGGAEVRAVEWVQQDSGSERLFDLRLSYQIFRGVRGEERVAIPELKLHFLADGKPVEVLVPAWEIKLASQIPAEQADADVRIREHISYIPYSRAGELQAFGLALLSLVLVVLSGAWILALPPFRWRRRQPFEQAWHDLTKLAKRGAVSMASEQQAYRIVHKALNRSAGFTVFSGRLDRYLNEKPMFEPLRARFEDFFSESWREFFGGQSTPTPMEEAHDDIVRMQPTESGMTGAKAFPDSASIHPGYSVDDGALAGLLEMARQAMDLERGRS
jgi:mxaA protein